MQFGYYGKTIHRGDFVKFNLPMTFVNVWDDWLQLILNEGDSRHGEHWGNIFGSSPAYRFCLSAGIAGENAWAGVMHPATDKVGRKFPFCMTVGLPSNVSPVVQADSLEPIYVAIENLVGRVLQPDYDFDQLQPEMAEHIESLESSFSDNTVASFAASDPDTSLAIRANANSLLQHAPQTSALLDAVLQQTWFSFSIWQPSGVTDERISSLLSCGLPTGSTGLALFDHAWKSTEIGRLNISDTVKVSAATSGAILADSGSGAETDITAETDDLQWDLSSADATLRDEDFSALTLDDEARNDETRNDEARNDETREDETREDESSEERAEVPLEFQKTEKIAAHHPIPDEQRVVADESAEPKPHTEDIKPVVEQLELDEESADQDPWDNS